MKPVSIGTDGSVREYLSGPTSNRTFEKLDSLNGWYRLGRESFTLEGFRTVVRLIEEDIGND